MRLAISNSEYRRLISYLCILHQLILWHFYHKYMLLSIYEVKQQIYLLLPKTFSYKPIYRSQQFRDVYPKPRKLSLYSLFVYVTCVTQRRDYDVTKINQFSDRVLLQIACFRFFWGGLKTPPCGVNLL